MAGGVAVYSNNGLSAFLEPLTRLNPAGTAPLNANNDALAREIRPYLNAAVCKYLKGVRAARIGRKRKRCRDQWEEDTLDCGDAVFDHWKQMAAGVGDANEISEGIIKANKAFNENGTPGVRIYIG